MKVRNVVIIVLTVICVGLAVTLGVFSRKYVPQVTESQAQSQTQQLTAKDNASSQTYSLALSDNSAYLTWNPVDGASGYYVYYDDGSGWKEYGKTQKNTFRKNGLTGGSSFLFGIKPYSISQKNEAVSDKFVYTFGGNTLPDTPQVKAKKQDDGFQLSWKRINHADKYAVYIMKPGETKWEHLADTKKTDYLIEKAPAKVFYVAVRAIYYADSKKFFSDYVKLRVTSQKTAGKLYSCGDSIAAGLGAHVFSYVNLFADERNLEVVNDARANAQLSSEKTGVNHICERIMQKVTAQYKYVLIEGGNNDYYFSSKLGTVSADGTKEFDMNTTCGALESALTYLKEKCPKTKVIVVLQHNATNKSEVKNKLGLTLTDYIDAMRAVCKKYGVAVADCYKESGLNTIDESLSSKYTHHFNGVYPKGDGLHPTEEGYSLFYMPVLNKADK